MHDKRARNVSSGLLSSHEFSYTKRTGLGMAWHKWFVRGLVFTIFAGAVLATLAYQHWTNPAAVRMQVLAKSLATFPGALVSLDSASLRILGGIQIRELNVTRRDDPAAEVAHVPFAILYHNKEKM